MLIKDNENLIDAAWTIVEYPVFSALTNKPSDVSRKESPAKSKMARKTKEILTQGSPGSHIYC